MRKKFRLFLKRLRVPNIINWIIHVFCAHVKCHLCCTLNLHMYISLILNFTVFHWLPISSALLNSFNLCSFTVPLILFSCAALSEFSWLLIIFCLRWQKCVKIYSYYWFWEISPCILCSLCSAYSDSVIWCMNIYGTYISSLWMVSFIKTLFFLEFSLLWY